MWPQPALLHGMHSAYRSSNGVLATAAIITGPSHELHLAAVMHLLKLRARIHAMSRDDLRYRMKSWKYMPCNHHFDKDQLSNAVTFT